jgi:GNAT superfamily N-acetyltransferase
MEATVSYIDSPTRAMWRAIAEPLALHNEAPAGGSGHHMPLVLVLRSNTDAIVGGLWGRINFSYLHIEMLFVPEALRNKGLGTQLLQLAERKAAERGCSGVWLQAYSFGALDFYEHRGYNRFGELQDLPAGHKEVFLWKPLTPSDHPIAGAL